MPTWNTTTLTTTLLFGAALAATAPHAFAETFVVRDAAALRDAVNAARPGDEIRVKGGTYAVNLDLSGKTGLLLRGSRGAKLVPLDPDLPTVFLSGARNVALEKLKIDGSLGGAVRIENSEDIVLARGKITGGYSLAATVSASNSRQVRITRTKFKGISRVMVRFGTDGDLPVNESTISQNKFQRTVGASIRVGGEQNVISRNKTQKGRTAIQLLGTPSGEPNIVRDNKLDQPIGYGIEVVTGTAVVEGNTTRLTRRDSLVLDGTGHTVNANKVRSSCRHGIVLESDDSIITDNVVKKSTLDGIVVTGDDNLLQSNELKKSGDVGVVIEGDNNVLAGNEFQGNEEPIVDDGDGTVINTVQ